MVEGWDRAVPGWVAHAGLSRTSHDARGSDLRGLVGWVGRTG